MLSNKPCSFWQGLEIGEIYQFRGPTSGWRILMKITASEGGKDAVILSPQGRGEVHAFTALCVSNEPTDIQRIAIDYYEA